MKYLIAILLLFNIPLAAVDSLDLDYEVVEDRVESQSQDFRLIKLASGFNNPWSMAFLPDGNMLISERAGDLYLFDFEKLVKVSGLPEIREFGQGGLLDLALHPNFERNKWLYFSYAGKNGREYGTVLARARLEGSELSNLQILFSINNFSNSNRHFGGRIAFDNEGFVYLTIGDRGERDRSQDTQDHAGTVIRLRSDGSIPDSNPFVKGDGAAEIFSYGHRNPQGMILNPISGDIWIHEHGAKGGDEVNILENGKNYGWPIISYGTHYDGTKIGVGTEAPGMEQPIVFWDPSIAPSGMMFYEGDKFPNWSGNIFLGALAKQHLRRLIIEGDQIVGQEVLLQSKIGRIRDVREGTDGFIYLLTDSNNGSLYKLEPISD
jgi:glucose/arabinose dehydrogenase